MAMVPVCKMCGGIIDAGQPCEMARLLQDSYTICKDCQPILREWYGDFARYHKDGTDDCDRCSRPIHVGDTCTMAIFGGLMGFLCEECTTQARVLLREVKFPTRNVLKRLA